MADYIEQIRKDLEEIEVTQDEIDKQRKRFDKLTADESRKSEGFVSPAEARQVQKCFLNCEQDVDKCIDTLKLAGFRLSEDEIRDVIATYYIDLKSEEYFYKNRDAEEIPLDAYNKIVKAAEKICGHSLPEYAVESKSKSRKSEAYTNLGEVEVEYNYTESGTVWLDIRRGDEKKYQIYGTIEGVFFDFEADDFAEARRIIEERLEENEIQPFDFDFTLFKSTESNASEADTVTKATFELKVRDTLKKLQAILDQFKSGDLEFENAYRSVVAVCNTLHREFPGKFPSKELNERGGDEPQSLYEYLGEEFAAGNTNNLDRIVDVQTALSAIASTLDQLNPADIEKINKRAPKIAKALFQLAAPYEYEVQGVAKLFRELGKEDKRLADAVDDALDRPCDIDAYNFEELISEIQRYLPTLLREASKAKDSFNVQIDGLAGFGNFKANKRALSHQIDRAVKEDTEVAQKILDLINQEWPKGVQVQKWGQGFIDAIEKLVEDDPAVAEYDFEFDKNNQSIINFTYERYGNYLFGTIEYNPTAEEYKVVCPTNKAMWDVPAEKVANVPTELIQTVSHPLAVNNVLIDMCSQLEDLYANATEIRESKYSKQIRKDLEALK